MTGRAAVYITTGNPPHNNTSTVLSISKVASGFCDRIVFFLLAVFAFSPLVDLLSLGSIAGYLVRYP